jgi:integrase
MTKRAAGQGSITEISTGHWVRVWEDGKRKSLGVHPTRVIAEGVLAQGLHARSLRGGQGGSAHTFGTFAKTALDIREGDDIRSVRNERNRFANHLADCSISDHLVSEITPANIADLRRELSKRLVRGARADGRTRISSSTVTACMVLVSAIFTEAVERGLRVDNPCVGIRKKNRRRKSDVDEDTEDKWDFLTGEEQRAFAACEHIPEWGRLIARFAWGTGLRQGEQWNLELRDVHAGKDEPYPRIVVRFGSKGRRPKNGKIRTVPLFGHALEAARRWLEILPTYAPKNPAGLMFPGAHGGRRGMGGPRRSVYTRVGAKLVQATEYLLPVWLRLAGIDRALRWHDLRHTCASSLVSGTWGPAWSLEEVKEMMGHSSVKVTERYAHPSEAVLRRAAARSQQGYSAGYGLVTEVQNLQ